jgi:predicted nucleic acid-binding protein
MIYFDSAYVVKCYLNETGSGAVRELAQSQPSLACCEYGRIEVTSTFHRNLSEGLLTTSQYELVAQQFESDDKNGVWTWLPLTADLCRKTAVRIHALPASAFIRAGDALHLTSAAQNGFAEIYSNDRHLQASAALFGLKAINVIRL